jgi:hypothetical protein
MSDIIRSISTWHSGSPKRTLYSNSFGPSGVSITPAYSTPRNGVPRAFMPLTVGTMIFAMISAWISSVTNGVGE